MNENKGWIKLHRKILDNPICLKPTWAWLWVTLLLLANHDETNKFIWNGKEMVQKRGQFVTGRKKLNEITGIPETTIERVLNYLENGQQIKQEKTTKYRLITILKWEEYQQNDSKVDNKRTTNGQQTDTIKNLKNIRIKEEDKNSDKSQVKESQYSTDGADIIKAFEDIDPKNKTYYSNKTQRSSADFLVDEYGKDRVMWVIKHLPIINKEQYIKKSYTPFQLKENWQSIKDHLESIKQKKNNSVAFK